MFLMSAWIAKLGEHVKVSEMSIYKYRLIRKIVYAMYRDRIRDFTNTSTYPACRDTRCRDNECRLYLSSNPRVLGLQLQRTNISLILSSYLVVFASGQVDIL